MQRKTLNKGDALWKQGEIADSLAIVESGKLGVMTDRRLTGIVWKGMVIGESAILSTSGRGVMRSAAVFALADGVSVKEIPAEEVKAAFDAGDRSLAMPVLITLVGEICRNSLLLIYSSQNRALVTRPMKALMEATIDAFRDDSRRMHDWTDFTTMVALLVASRDYTERMRAELGVDGSDRAAITKASDAIREVFKDHEALEAIQATIEAEIDRESLKASLDPDKVFEFVVRG